MKKNIRNNIEVILVEPSQPGNIGASARAINNMGFNKLGLVKPVEFNVPDTYKMAWQSHDIIDKAKVYSSIKEAIKDKGYIVAMSTRKGKDRGHFEVLSDFKGEIHKAALNSKVAILFGCESWGLTNEDLKYANRVVRIHTANKFTSLNLSQAVLITLYELLCSDDIPKEEGPKPASSKDLELCFDHIEKVLYKIGYGAKGKRLEPGNILKVMRRMTGRAILDGKEVKMLRGLCSQVEKTIEGFNFRDNEKA